MRFLAVGVRGRRTDMQDWELAGRAERHGFWELKMFETIERTDCGPVPASEVRSFGEARQDAEEVQGGQLEEQPAAAAVEGPLN